jgi:hypothetical protein
LLVVEKLLRLLQQKQTGDLSQFLIFRFCNVHLMLQVFKIEGDYKRVLKFLETNNKSNLHLLDSLAYICRRPRVKRELAYYILHILSMKAGAVFKYDSAEKAMTLYQ